MTLSVLLGIASLLVEYALLFLVGELLLYPEQIRHYFGWSTTDGDDTRHRQFNGLVRIFGRCLQLSAVIGFVLSIAVLTGLVSRIA